MRSFLSRNKNVLNRKGYTKSQVYDTVQERGNAK